MFLLDMISPVTIGIGLLLPVIAIAAIVTIVLLILKK